MQTVTTQKQNKYLALEKHYKLLLIDHMQHRIVEDFILLFSQTKTLTIETYVKR